MNTPENTGADVASEPHSEPSADAPNPIIKARRKPSRDPITRRKLRSPNRKRPCSTTPKVGSKAQAIISLASTTPATPAQIAQALDCPISTVHSTLSRYGIQINTAEIFDKYKQHLFSGFAGKYLLKALTSDIKVENARDIKDLMVSIGIAYDKNALELGKPTQIIDLRSFSLTAQTTLDGLQDELIRRRSNDAGNPDV
jgi:hypothetical protein